MKKILKIMLIIIIVTITISITIINNKNRNKIAVLGYHSIYPHKINTSGDNLIVDQEKFEKEIKILKKMGYKSMSLEEFYCWKNKKCSKPRKSVLITFDDGYMNNYQYAFNILKKYDMKATVFVVGNYVQDENNSNFLNLDTLDSIKKEYPNIEIASHSYNLHYHSDKNYDTVNTDIEEMKKIVDSEFYAYPYGDYTEEYIQALKDNNYKIAFTFGPGRHHRKADITDDNYLIPRLNISNDMPYWKFILRTILPM